MDSSLDDLVAQGKGRIDRPRKNFSKGGRKQHFTPRYGPKEDGEKGEKEEVPRLQAALKGMDVLNSSLEDIIAVERKSGAGKGNRKGGKSKGKGGKDFRKGQQMFNITTFEDRSKGKGKGGFRPNFGGNFGGGALPEWDFTATTGSKKDFHSLSNNPSGRARFHPKNRIHSRNSGPGGVRLSFQQRLQPSSQSFSSGPSFRPLTTNEIHNAYDNARMDVGGNDGYDYDYDYDSGRNQHGGGYRNNAAPRFEGSSAVTPSNYGYQHEPSNNMPNGGYKNYTTAQGPYMVDNRGNFGGMGQPMMSTPHGGGGSSGPPPQVIYVSTSSDNQNQLNMDQYRHQQPVLMSPAPQAGGGGGHHPSSSRGELSSHHPQGLHSSSNQVLDDHLPHSHSQLNSHSQPHSSQRAALQNAPQQQIPPHAMHHQPLYQQSQQALPFAPQASFAPYDMPAPHYQQRQDMSDRRGRSRSPPAKRHQGTFGRRILVDNIPRNLAAKDLEEAFLEVGKVQDVEVDGGKAWVVFSSAKEAYEAEHRYDGGQINHQIIRVSVK